MKGFVYIIQSLKTNRNYLGSSTDPVRRLIDHNRGNTNSTKQGRPWKLIFVQEFETLNLARRVERKLKSFKSAVILRKILDSGRIMIEII